MANACRALMNFSELFKPSLLKSEHQSCYDKEDIEIIDNNEDDIKDLVEEMLERYK